MDTDKIKIYGSRVRVDSMAKVWLVQYIYALSVHSITIQPRASYSAALCGAQCSSKWCYMYEQW
jgi:hypothetical protein